MFDDNTKKAWQTIQPDAELKARALSQKPKKVVAFPPNLIKTTAAVAACLIIAVNVLGLLTGVTISVNWYTVLSACLFGIPSTITIVLLDMFLI